LNGLVQQYPFGSRETDGGYDRDGIRRKNWREEAEAHLGQGDHIRGESSLIRRVAQQKKETRRG